MEMEVDSINDSYAEADWNNEEAKYDQEKWKAYQEKERINKKLRKIQMQDMLAMKKPNEALAKVPKPRDPLPTNALPTWKDYPLDAKLPSVPAPDGTFHLSRNPVGKKLFLALPEQEFDNLDPYIKETPVEYVPLHDPNLKEYFKQNYDLIDRLQSLGLVTQEGEVACSLEDLNKYRLYLSRIHKGQLKKEREKQEEAQIFEKIQTKKIKDSLWKEEKALKDGELRKRREQIRAQEEFKKMIGRVREKAHRSNSLKDERAMEIAMRRRLSELKSLQRNARIDKLRKAEIKRIRKLILKWLCKETFSKQFRAALQTQKKLLHQADLADFITMKKDYQERKLKYNKAVSRRNRLEQKCMIAKRQRDYEDNEELRKRQYAIRSQKEVERAQRTMFLMKKYGGRWLAMLRRKKDQANESVWHIRHQLRALVAYLKENSGAKTLTAVFQDLMKMKSRKKEGPKMSAETREAVEYATGRITKRINEEIAKMTTSCLYEHVQNASGRVQGPYYESLDEKEFIPPEIPVRQKPRIDFQLPQWPCTGPCAGFGKRRKEWKERCSEMAEDLAKIHDELSQVLSEKLKNDLKTALEDKDGGSGGSAGSGRSGRQPGGGESDEDYYDHEYETAKELVDEDVQDKIKKAKRDNQRELEDALRNRMKGKESKKVKGDKDSSKDKKKEKDSSSSSGLAESLVKDAISRSLHGTQAGSRADLKNKMKEKESKMKIGDKSEGKQKSEKEGGKSKSSSDKNKDKDKDTSSSSGLAESLVKDAISKSLHTTPAASKGKLADKSDDKKPPKDKGPTSDEKDTNKGGAKIEDDMAKSQPTAPADSKPKTDEKLASKSLHTTPAASKGKLADKSDDKKPPKDKGPTSDEKDTNKGGAKIEDDMAKSQPTAPADSKPKTDEKLASKSLHTTPAASKGKLADKSDDKKPPKDKGPTTDKKDTNKGGAKIEGDMAKSQPTAPADSKPKADEKLADGVPGKDKEPAPENRILDETKETSQGAEGIKDADEISKSPPGKEELGDGVTTPQPTAPADSKPKADEKLADGVPGEDKESALENRILDETKETSQGAEGIKGDDGISKSPPGKEKLGDGVTTSQPTAPADSKPKADEKLASKSLHTTPAASKGKLADKSDDKKPPKDKGPTSDEKDTNKGGAKIEDDMAKSQPTAPADSKPKADEKLADGVPGKDKESAPENKILDETKETSQGAEGIKDADEISKSPPGKEELGDGVTPLQPIAPADSKPKTDKKLADGVPGEDKESALENRILNETKETSQGAEGIKRDDEISKSPPGKEKLEDGVATSQPTAPADSKPKANEKLADGVPGEGKGSVPENKILDETKETSQGAEGIKGDDEISKSPPGKEELGDGVTPPQPTAPDDSKPKADEKLADGVPGEDLESAPENKILDERKETSQGAKGIKEDDEISKSPPSEEELGDGVTPAASRIINKVLAAQDGVPGKDMESAPANKILDETKETSQGAEGIKDADEISKSPPGKEKLGEDETPSQPTAPDDSKPKADEKLADGVPGEDKESAPDNKILDETKETSQGAEGIKEDDEISKSPSSEEEFGDGVTPAASRIINKILAAQDGVPGEDIESAPENKILDETKETSQGAEGTKGDDEISKSPPVKEKLGDGVTTSQPFAPVDSKPKAGEKLADGVPGEDKESAPDNKILDETKETSQGAEGIKGDDEISKSPPGKEEVGDGVTPPQPTAPADSKPKADEKLADGVPSEGKESAPENRILDETKETSQGAEGIKEDDEISKSPPGKEELGDGVTPVASRIINEILAAQTNLLQRENDMIGSGDETSLGDIVTEDNLSRVASMFVKKVLCKETKTILELQTKICTELGENGPEMTDKLRSYADELFGTEVDDKSEGAALLESVRAKLEKEVASVPPNSSSKAPPDVRASIREQLQNVKSQLDSVKSELEQAGVRTKSKQDSTDKDTKDTKE